MPHGLDKKNDIQGSLDAQTGTQAGAQVNAQGKQQSSVEAFFLYTWYKKQWRVWLWLWLLIPFSWLYHCVSALYSSRQKKRQQKLSVPVVVIGNISVGGTGKTPVIVALANALGEQGIAVGIISRGYGSDAAEYPYHVTPESDASNAGDEPLLIARSTHCPVVIDRNRVAAGQALLNLFPEVQIILSDDGLQHYALYRDIEVVIIDGSRGLGNHFCLPAGPLREPARRLATVDWILLNSEKESSKLNDPDSEESCKPLKNNDLSDDLKVKNSRFQAVNIKPVAWNNIASQTSHPLQPLPWLDHATAHVTDIKAVAGIGHPQRFFNTLESLGIVCDSYSFSDHYQFEANDFAKLKESVILMTEKDAMKCQDFATAQWWSLSVEIVLPKNFIDDVAQLADQKPY